MDLGDLVKLIVYLVGELGQRRAAGAGRLSVSGAHRPVHDGDLGRRAGGADAARRARRLGQLARSSRMPAERGQTAVVVPVANAEPVDLGVAGALRRLRRRSAWRGAHHAVLLTPFPRASSAVARRRRCTRCAMLCRASRPRSTSNSRRHRSAFADRALPRAGARATAVSQDADSAALAARWPRGATRTKAASRKSSRT